MEISATEIRDVVVAGLREDHLLDWMAGTAGTIATLLYLAQQHRAGDLIAVARECGDDLCAKAQWTDSECNWICEDLSGAKFEGVPLGGFSHGTTGCAHALLELFDVTGEPRYLATAKAALAYEDTLFDRTKGNWVDARFRFQRDEDGRIDGTFVTAWCHGAGGIALTRLRAATIDAENRTAHQQAADVALARVQESIEEFISADRFDASLCHGTLGLSEVLLIAAGLTDNLAYKERCQATATHAISLYGENQDWPCGASADVPHPSLMLGVSGIGHHLLRLAGCKVDPVLILNQFPVSRGNSG